MGSKFSKISGVVGGNYTLLITIGLVTDMTSSINSYS